MISVAEFEHKRRAHLCYWNKYFKTNYFNFVLAKDLRIFDIRTLQQTSLLHDLSDITTKLMSSDRPTRNAVILWTPLIVLSTAVLCGAQ